VLPDASLLAIAPGSEIAAAILTVERAPWDDLPECPFIYEDLRFREWRPDSSTTS